VNKRRKTEEVLHIEFLKGRVRNGSALFFGAFPGGIAGLRSYRRVSMVLGTEKIYRGT